MEVKKSGFSLIEILVVVAIVSFLTVLIVPYFRSQIYRANDARRKADLKIITQAVEEYEKDFSCYPLSTGDLVGYLENIPRDPTFKTVYPYETDGTACSRWFRLFSTLQNTKDPNYQTAIGPVALPKIYNFLVTSPNAPITVPTSVPTAVPTAIPTTVPTSVPTSVPTAVPTSVPTSPPK